MWGARYRVLAVVALLGLSACGDPGPIGGRATPTSTPATPAVTRTATSTPDGTLTATTTPNGTLTNTPTPNGTLTPTRTPGGSDSILPDICVIGRVVFRSQTGEKCCIATDPALLPQMPRPGQPSLVLTDLPLGPATVTIDGYVEDFVPLPEDFAMTGPERESQVCKTLNGSGVRPCDTLDQAPAYGSQPKAVTIFGGVRVNLGDIQVNALPFLLDLEPEQNESVAVPVQMGFTVVDAETGIAAPSVALDITLDVPQGEPPVFRPITKRVPLDLDPCRDGTGQPCSAGDNLGVTGFLARAVAEYLDYLPNGPVDARITAQNLADPPRDLDFRYRFFVGPAPSPTPPADNSLSAGAAAGVAIIPTPTPTPTPVEP
jgi:hypothetical protein